MKIILTEGRVESIADPSKAGRIQVSLKEMDGNIYPLWLRPALTPGWIAMPEVGHTVKVVVPDGDDMVEFAEEAYYLGRQLDSANTVPDDFKDNYPKRRGFRSPAGHFLLFDDDDGIVLTVGSSGGNNIGLSIDAKSGSVKLYGTTSVQIEALGAVTINGTSVTILNRPVSPGGGPI